MRSNADEVGLGQLKFGQIVIGFIEIGVSFADLGIQTLQVFHQAGVFERNPRLAGNRGQHVQVFISITAVGFRPQANQTNPLPFGEDRDIDIQHQTAQPFALGQGRGHESRGKVDIVL